MVRFFVLLQVIFPFVGGDIMLKLFSSSRQRLFLEDGNIFSKVLANQHSISWCYHPGKEGSCKYIE